MDIGLLGMAGVAVRASTFILKYGCGCTELHSLFNSLQSAREAELKTNSSSMGLQMLSTSSKRPREDCLNGEEDDDGPVPAKMVKVDDTLWNDYYPAGKCYQCNDGGNAFYGSPYSCDQYGAAAAAATSPHQCWPVAGSSPTQQQSQSPPQQQQQQLSSTPPPHSSLQPPQQPSLQQQPPHLHQHHHHAPSPTPTPPPPPHSHHQSSPQSLSHQVPTTNINTTNLNQTNSQCNLHLSSHLCSSGNVLANSSNLTSNHLSVSNCVSVGGGSGATPGSYHSPLMPHHQLPPLALHHHHHHHHHHHNNNNNNNNGNNHLHQPQQQSPPPQQQQTIRCDENGKSYLDLGSGSSSSSCLANSANTSSYCGRIAASTATSTMGSVAATAAALATGTTTVPTVANPTTNLRSPCNSKNARCGCGIDDYERRRINVLNLSMFKLGKYRAFPDPSLYRSVLICNTLRHIEREMEQEGCFASNQQTAPLIVLEPPPEPPRAPTPYPQTSGIGGSCGGGSGSSNSGGSSILGGSGSGVDDEEEDNDSGIGDDNRSINWGSVLSLSSQSDLDPLNNNDSLAELDFSQDLDELIPACKLTSLSVDDILKTVPSAGQSPTKESPDIENIMQVLRFNS